MKKVDLFRRVNAKMRFLITAILAVVVLSTFQSCNPEDEIEPGEASIISFTIGDIQASIDETAKTGSIELAAGTDVTSLIPSVVLSADATISPDPNSGIDFSNPVTFTITDISETVTAQYTVTVISAELRLIAFIGQAAENTPESWDATKGGDYDLMDDQTAADWFATTMDNSNTDVAYFSFEDVAAGQDLSEYHAVWIQYDGGTWGGVVASFPNNAEGKHCLLGETGVAWESTCDDKVTAFVNAIKGYYEAGGNLLLGNYAGAIVDEIGVVSQPEYAPNNSWGGPDVDAGATDSEWRVRWAGEITSPLFEGIGTVADDGIPAPAFVFIEAGGEKKNRSNQYNLNFGPWAPNGDADPLTDRRASFESMTGATVLVENGGQNEPQVVMWDASGNKGAVIACLGGTYDWYIGATMSGTDRNIKKFTANALNYLVDQAIDK